LNREGAKDANGFFKEKPLGFALLDHQGFQTFMVKKAQQLQGRSAGAPVSGFPLLNGRQADVEDRRHGRLAEVVPFPEAANLFGRIAWNRFNPIGFTESAFVDEPWFTPVLSGIMNRL